MDTLALEPETATRKCMEDLAFSGTSRPTRNPGACCHAAPVSIETVPLPSPAVPSPSSRQPGAGKTSGWLAFHLKDLHIWKGEGQVHDALSMCAMEMKRW